MLSFLLNPTMSEPKQGCTNPDEYKYNGVSPIEGLEGVGFEFERDF